MPERELDKNDVKDKSKKPNLIYIQLVPKGVDNPKIFQDTEDFIEYSEAQAHQFIAKLPNSYVANIHEEKMHSACAIFDNVNPPYNLTLRFTSGYHFMQADEKGEWNWFHYPNFNLFFSPTKETKKVLTSILDSFFVRVSDEGTLIALERKNGKPIRTGLDVFAAYLPEGTKIEARSNEFLANNEFVYELKDANQNLFSKIVGYFANIIET